MQRADKLLETGESFVRILLISGAVSQFSFIFAGLLSFFFDVCLFEVGNGCFLLRGICCEVMGEALT